MCAWTLLLQVLIKGNALGFGTEEHCRLKASSQCDNSSLFRSLLLPVLPLCEHPSFSVLSNVITVLDIEIESDSNPVSVPLINQMFQIHAHLIASGVCAGFRSSKSGILYS